MTNEPERTHRPTCLALLLLAPLAAACGGAEPGTGGQEPSLTSGAPGRGGAGADVAVLVNVAPRLTSLGGDQTLVVGAGGPIRSQAALRATAVDDDGDELAFRWSSPDCLEALAAAVIDGGRDGASGGGWSTAAFEPPDDRACLVEVEVRDLGPEEVEQGDASSREEKGGVAVGRLQLSGPPAFVTGGAE